MKFQNIDLCKFILKIKLEIYSLQKQTDKEGTKSQILIK